MDFKEYQEKSKETMIYPKLNPSWIYPALGLSGEAGEISEKLKKILRDKEGKVSDNDKDAIKKEIGDVIWYLSAICTELDLSLDDAAKNNIEKLQSRKNRSALKGKGDYR
jgi:NTP pyrophosphatase (non-canonical NTP hydrolase)